MARVVLSEASVRINADTRQGEKDAASAGERFGRAFAAGADRGAGQSDFATKAAADVDTAASKVEAARNREADAAGRLRVAETKLDEVRFRENATASQIAAAEERVAAAHRNLTTTQTAVISATDRLRDATAKLNTEHEKTVSVSDRLGAAFRKLTTDADGNTSVFVRLRAAFSALGGDGESVGRRIDTAFKAINLTGLLTNLLKVGGGLAAAGVAAVGMQAAVGGAAIAIVGLVGAVGQLSGVTVGLPALLGAVGLAVATLKIGFSGFGDALKNIGDPQKFADALKNLAPAAQATAISIRDMKPAFDELRLDVQQRLFLGLAEPVKQLGATYLPILRTNLDTVASAFNKAFKSTTGFFTTPAVAKDLSTALGSVAVGVSKTTSALQPLAAAFTDVFAVGAAFGPRFGQAISDLATRFANFIESARASGRLAEFFNDGITAAKQFGQVFVNIGSTLGGVFRAAQSATGGFLAGLVSVTTELRNVVNSVAGQQQLTAFFTGTKAAIQALLPVINTVFQLLGTIGPALSSIGTTVAPILKQVLDNLVSGVKNAIPGVVAFAEAFAKAVGTLGPLLPLLGSVVSGIGFALAGALQAVTPLLSALVSSLTFLGPVLGPIAVVLGTVAITMTGVGIAVKAVTTVLGLLGPVIRGLAVAWEVLNLAFALSPIGAIITALVLLAAGLVLAYQHSETFRNIVNGAFTAVGNVITSVIGFFADLPGKIGAALGAVGAAVATGATAAWNFLTTSLTTAINTVIGFFTNLPQNIAFALGFLAGEIFNGATAAWNFLWNTLPAAVAAVLGFLAALPGQVVGAIASLGPLVGGLASAAWDGFVNITTSAANNVIGFVAGVPGAIAGGIAALPGIVVNAATAAWQGFVNATVSGANSAVGFVAGVPGQITGFFAGAGSWLFNAGAAIIQGLINGLASAAQSVLNYIANLAARVRDGFAAAIQIGSPSRVFAGFGKNIGEGLIQGISVITPAAENAAKQLALAVTNSGQIDPGGASGSVSQVTGAALGSGTGGLNLDGLAAAFAQAINAAQLVAKGSDLTMVVNAGNRSLARRR